MQLSYLSGKQIVTQSGKRLGYITGVYLDRGMKKLSCLAAADDNEEEFFLPVRAVLSFGDAVIAKEMHYSSPSGVRSPVGLPAFTETGDSLGVVGDLLLGEESSFILVKDGVRTSVPADCVRTGDTVIVYPSPEARPRRRPHRAKPKPEQDIPPAPQEEIPKQEGPGGKDDFRCNLLGKRVKKDVFDGEGNLIAAAGEKIVPEMLSLARRKNRLLALAVNTLTNLF